MENSNNWQDMANIFLQTRTIKVKFTSPVKGTYCAQPQFAGTNQCIEGFTYHFKKGDVVESIMVLGNTGPMAPTTMRVKVDGITITIPIGHTVLADPTEPLSKIRRTPNSFWWGLNRILPKGLTDNQLMFVGLSLLGLVGFGIYKLVKSK